MLGRGPVSNRGHVTVPQRERVLTLCASPLCVDVREKRYGTREATESPFAPRPCASTGSYRPDGSLPRPLAPDGALGEKGRPPPPTARRFDASGPAAGVLGARNWMCGLCSSSACVSHSKPAAPCFPNGGLAPALPDRTQRSRSTPSLPGRCGAEVEQPCGES